VNDEVLDSLTGGQGAEAIGSDGREVNKEISGTVLGSDVSETLVLVEPLNGARGSRSVGHGWRRGGVERNRRLWKNLEVSFRGLRKLWTLNWSEE